MASLQSLAIADNAAWCDLVCRTHGISGRFDLDAWTSAVRTPPYFPDAVTLVPDVSVAELLARIDVSPGCSVKDSFATVELADDGFRVLFEAEWIAHVPATPRSPATPKWTVVDPDGFDAWETAWRGDTGPGHVLLADLVAQDSVVVTAGLRGGRILEGAILHRGSGAIGVSNVFAHAGVDATASWSGCVELAARLFPGSILVGYESGDALASACANGFVPAGPLRVWVHGS